MDKNGHQITDGCLIRIPTGIFGNLHRIFNYNVLQCVQMNFSNHWPQKANEYEPFSSARCCIYKRSQKQIPSVAAMSAPVKIKEDYNTQQDLFHGNLVWAKCFKRSPAWPAIVIDPLQKAHRNVCNASVPKTICVIMILSYTNLKCISLCVFWCVYIHNVTNL